jgi:GWxTD domain-containing protein
MREPRPCAVLLLVLFGLALAAMPANSQKAPKPDKTFDAWLKDEVHYLITGEEKKLFLSLRTDGERNAFISAFWARRDPLPVTAANEFKDEHYRRLAEAKSKYGVHTDRGRIYILLGPPNAIDNETSGKIVFPCEVWNYTNLNLPGFPNSLRLLFFKQWGVGPLRLYSPLFDGLEYLVPQRHYDFGYGNDSQLRNLIRSYMGIDFLMATQSVTAGTDQLESERILATLRDPAAFDVLSPSDKPLVTTTVSLEKLPFEADGFFSEDGRGNFYYDVSLSVSPADLTFERSGEKIYGRADVFVTVRDRERNVVAQFNDQLSLELTEAEMEAKKGYGLAYAFSQLLVPGEYTVNILLRDFVSSRVGEKDLPVSLPGTGRSTPLLLAGRIVPLSLEVTAATGRSDAARMPFTFGKNKVVPRTDGVFGPEDNIHLYFEILRQPADSGDYRVEYAIRDARQVRVRSDEEALSLPAGQRSLPVNKVFSPKGLAEGVHTLSVRVEDALSGTSVLESYAPFTVSAAPRPPGTFAFEQDYRPSPETRYTELGRQSFFRRDFAGARRFFGIALSTAPGYLPAKILLAKCHAVEGNDGPALDLLLPLAEGGANDGEVFTVLGSIYYARKDLERTARYLERAAELSVESVEVLNFLGSVYLEMGKRDKARDILSRSLLIRADQPLVKSLLESLGK